MTEQPTPPEAPAPPVAPGPPKARAVSQQEMKAFTHPLRMRMYRLLQDHGEATSSMLARETGESTGQTSYHLRQLERFGFVEEVPDAGKGRERWWKSLGFSYEGDHSASDEALTLLQRWSLDNLVQDLTTAIQRVPDEHPIWLESGSSTSHTQWMTASELAALTRELLEVINRHADAAKKRHNEHGIVPDSHSRTRDDERRVRVYVNALALPPLEGQPATEDE